MPPEDKKTLQKYLHRFLIEDVFNTVTEEDILQIKGPNAWYSKGRQLTAGEIQIYRKEALSFKESGIWKLLRSEILWLAKKGYSKSVGAEDLIAVKVLELFIQTLDKKLEEMIVI